MGTVSLVGAGPSLPPLVYPNGGAAHYGAPQARYQAFGRCSQAKTSGSASTAARRS